MQKPAITIFSLISVLVFSFFAVNCSERGSPPSEPELRFNDITVTDIDGNIYPTVGIGGQLWMAENLKVTRFRNGEMISLVQDNGAWAEYTAAARCTYGNDTTNVDSYGLLYNWHAVIDERDIAPVGWHVPSDAEWQILINYLGGSSVAGSKMKNSVGWYNDGDGTNSSQFTALPAGNRSSNGLFDGVGSGASFWTSTEISIDGAWGRWLSHAGSGIGRDDANRLDGFSVRCVRD